MSVQISMVLLNAPSIVFNLSAMGDFLEEAYPDLPRIGDTTDQDQVASFMLGRYIVALGHMPAPIPWSDLEGPSATSILWPENEAIAQGHPSHLIVTVLPGEGPEATPIEMATVLTQVTAAVLAAHEDAAGVYWGNATQLIRKSIFIEFAREVLPDGPPIHIWVDIRVGLDTENTSAGFTTGMKALGHMEIETDRCPEPPNELRDRFMNLASYLLDKGPVIKDGNTVGGDKHEKIRVVYSDSQFGIEGQVMRLVYESESPKRPWWKLW